MILLKDSPVRRESHYLPGDKFTACLKRALNGVFNACAARNLHSHNSHAFDVVVRDYLCELFGIITIIELWTAYKCNSSSDEIIVKAAVGICRAVGGNEKIGVVKIGSVDGNELYLTRPL